MNDPKDPDVPTGLPDEGDREPPPLGTPHPDQAPEPGPDAMPGIASDGEPPSSG